LSAGDGPARQAALAAAAGEDLPVTFDPGELYASRGTAALAPLLRRSTILFLNRREVHLLYGTMPAETVLLEAPRVAVVVKDGAEGLEIISGEGRFLIPPFPVAAVDATGAGDAAAAGFLAGLRKGWSLPRCGRIAALCGALATTLPGREGFPDGRVFKAVDDGCDGDWRPGQCLPGS
jgi:ribokinase